MVAVSGRARGRQDDVRARSGPGARRRPSPISSPTFTIGHRYARADARRAPRPLPARRPHPEEWGDLEPYFDGTVASSNGPSTAATGCPRPASWLPSVTSTRVADASRSPMRTILAFDTATSVASCSLIRDGGAGCRAGPTHARCSLRRTLARRGRADASDLDGLVVGTGPGSFTSIRMGLATARGLGFALALPVAGVSTLLGFAGGDAVIDAQAAAKSSPPARRRPPEELDRRRAPSRR